MAVCDADATKTLLDFSVFHDYAISNIVKHCLTTLAYQAFEEIYDLSKH